MGAASNSLRVIVRLSDNDDELAITKQELEEMMEVHPQQFHDQRVITSEPELFNERNHAFHSATNSQAQIVPINANENSLEANQAINAPQIDNNQVNNQVIQPNQLNNIEQLPAENQLEAENVNVQPAVIQTNVAEPELIHNDNHAPADILQVDPQPIDIQAASIAPISSIHDFERENDRERLN